jgi:hypothetical protein
MGAPPGNQCARHRVHAVRTRPWRATEWIAAVRNEQRRPVVTVGRVNLQKGKVFVLLLARTDGWGLFGCRTACRYGGKNIAFHVNEGSTSFWLSLLVEFEDGDGDIGSMQLKQVTTHQPFFSSHFTPRTSRVHLSAGTSAIRRHFSSVIRGEEFGDFFS